MVYPFSDHINGNFGESKRRSRVAGPLRSADRASFSRRMRPELGENGRRVVVSRPGRRKDSKGSRTARRRRSLFNVQLATSFAPVEHSESLTFGPRRYDGPFSWLPIAAGSGRSRTSRRSPGYSARSCIFQRQLGDALPRPEDDVAEAGDERVIILSNDILCSS